MATVSPFTTPAAVRALASRFTRVFVSAKVSVRPSPSSMKQARSGKRAALSRSQSPSRMPLTRSSWLAPGDSSAMRGADAGRMAGDRLGALHVVVPAGDEALGEQAAAGLEVGDQMPAAVGVGRQVADGVEQPQAVLGRDVGT